MDQICCLLGLCCPPEARQERVCQWFVSMGAHEKSAEAIAKGLIAALDASALGGFLKAIAASIKHD